MKTSKLILLPVCLLSVQSLVAQESTNYGSHKRNLFKVNVTSPVLKNYSVQYERILTKRVSVAISGRLMPASTVPFKRIIKNNINEGEDIKFVNDILNQVKVSNYAITPELRLYVGKKGYGQGFYIAPYYRFANYELHNSTISVDDAGQNYHVLLSGKITSHTGGLQLGSQWNLGKSVGLDLWILGPNIGEGKGSVSGISDNQLTTAEQADLKRRLEEIDIPYIKETVTVSANGANMSLNGLWGGVRAGLLFTFRF